MNPETASASSPAQAVSMDDLQTSRSGVWLAMDTGQPVLSCFCSGGTFNFGFCSPEVQAEVLQLIRKGDSGMWPLPSVRRTIAEQQFSVILPAPLCKTYFVSSASEAFEVACKFAKRITGRPNLISATGGYFGHVGFSLAMDDPAFRPQDYAPLSGGIRKVVYGAIDSLAEQLDDTVAAVCMETIQIPAGVVEPPDGYLAEVRRLCDRHGALLILDEVQGGLRRTGKIWAFQHHGIVPDLLVSGKGITGGYYPCGALSFAEKHLAAFQSPVPVHVTSYAGNEIGAALAAALAQRYADPAMGDHVDRTGRRLVDGLDRLTRQHPAVLNPGVRGRGLIRAVDVTAPGLRDRLFAGCMRHGLFVRGSAVNPNAIHFQPPLIITEDEVTEALARFGRAVAELDINAGSAGRPGSTTAEGALAT